MTKEKVQRNSYLEKRKRKHQQEEHEGEIVDVSKAEKIVEDNYKNIIIGALAIVALAAVFIFFNHSGKKGEQKAEAAAIGAQNFFAEQNWQAAIDGEGETLGFAEIADKYGKTNIGNLANYYTGVSYMKTGEYQKAIDALKQYKATDDPNINGLAIMNLADAQMELGQKEDALKNYDKAANINSELFQADFLLRYGMALVKANENADAKTIFEKITKQYPGTMQSNTAEQYLAGL